MRKFTVILLLLVIVVPVSAAQIEAPEVPPSGERLMPEAESFGEGLLMIMEDLLPLIRPDLYEASKVCFGMIATAMLCSLLCSASERIKVTADIVATAAIAASMFLSVGSLVNLADYTISEMTEYGKLLLPVMTTALAAQGAAGTSTALYAGTAVVDHLISTLISSLLTPIVYLFLSVSVAAAATGEEMLKKLKDGIRSIVTWGLKTLLTVFTAYMGMTGVISGTADAAALKVTKAAMSTFVPVIGGILSESSEAVLLSVGLAKNAAGLYGIFAILAIFLEPFLLIGCHYLLLKVTAAICGVIGTKSVAGLVEDMSSGMGLLLAMTGAVCLLLLISCVCFLKGVS